ncbi:MAG: sulfite exporter TauE/SafE family protein [Planctomycetota bacterium]
MTAIAEGFVFGLASSVHCAAMCGPLALAAGSGSAPVLSYHAGRTAAYVAVGGALGALGAVGSAGRLSVAAPWIGFVLALALVLGAFGLDRWLGAIPGAGGLVRRMLGRVRTWPTTWRTATLGAVTPLLPCGVLWALYGAALLAGGPLDAAATTLGFALGSSPLLLAAQTQGPRLRRFVRPEHARTLTRWVFLTAAAILIWRGTVALQGHSCCD